MRRLTIIREKQTFTLPYEEGDTVLRILQKNGFSLPASCGGRGTCGHCRVLIDGVLHNSCQVTASPDMTVTIPADPGDTQIEILPPSDSHGVSSPDGRYGIAIDLGTTTIALALVDSASHAVIASAGCQNPGVVYGADVLNRIEASNQGRRSELQEHLRSCLYREITGLLEREAIPPGQLDRICIAANTVMCHLLLGLSCETLGRAPFRPVRLDYPVMSARDLLGRDFPSPAKAVILPGISAFLGGDISSGLFALDFLDGNANSLFIDLGTNGEMALRHSAKILGASVAAGPAFEGSRIPGSEVLSAVCEMLQKKALDQTGLLQGIFFHTGYQYRGMLFTQEDIRAIQLAKASVRAGIETLLHTAGLAADEIDRVFLCGGFGTHTRTEQAAAISMLPEAFLGKIQSAGNTSLAGAVRCLFSPSDAYFQQLKKETELIELSSLEFYKEQYVHWMNFL